MDKARRRKELTAEMQRQDAAIAKMVDSPYGPEAMRILDSLFGGISHNLQNPNPYNTAFKEGQRSVIHYMKQCLEEAANELEIT